MGGFNGHSCLSSAEIYDPEANEWELMQPMASRRSGVSCAAFGNSIYVLGKFSSEFSIKQGQWDQDKHPAMQNDCKNEKIRMYLKKIPQKKCFFNKQKKLWK